MKNWKAILLLLTAVCLGLCLCACGGETETTAPETQGTTEGTDVTDTTEGVFNGYTVHVTDENGIPLQGAFVQLCSDNCYPLMTDETGTAKYDLPEADYKVSFITLPAGYTYSGDAQEFYFADGEKEITVALKAE